jgi:hypothetical protein
MKKLSLVAMLIVGMFASQVKAQSADVKDLQNYCASEMLHRLIKYSNDPKGQILLNMEQVLHFSGYSDVLSTPMTTVFGSRVSTAPTSNGKVNIFTGTLVFHKPELHGKVTTTAIEVSGVIELTSGAKGCSPQYLIVEEITLKSSKN